jgi:hypothetical protein
MDELPQALKYFEEDGSKLPAAEAPGKAQVKIKFIPFYAV